MSAEANLCPGCGIEPGKFHTYPCDVARCPMCGGQRLMCAIMRQHSGTDVWSGEWPGMAECREFGWYVKQDVLPFERCDANWPGGVMEDLNRLFTDAVWSREHQRWVLRDD